MSWRREGREVGGRDERRVRSRVRLSWDVFELDDDPEKSARVGMTCHWRYV